jgi:hypothetical protein
MVAAISFVVRFILKKAAWAMSEEFLKMKQIAQEARSTSSNWSRLTWVVNTP